MLHTLNICIHLRHSTNHGMVNKNSQGMRSTSKNFKDKTVSYTLKLTGEL